MEKPANFTVVKEVLKWGFAACLASFLAYYMVVNQSNKIENIERMMSSATADMSKFVKDHEKAEETRAKLTRQICINTLQPGTPVTVCLE